MSFAQWEPKYATGHNTVDQQHQHLFKLVNDLHVAMLERRGKEALLTTLEQLGKYVDTHFRTEEALMQQRGYPKLAQHRACHDKLTAKARLLIGEFRAGKISVTVELSIFLADWLRHHILGEDIALVGWLKGQEAKG